MVAAAGRLSLPALEVGLVVRGEVVVIVVQADLSDALAAIVGVGTAAIVGIGTAAIVGAGTTNTAGLLVVLLLLACCCCSYLRHSAIRYCISLHKKCALVALRINPNGASSTMGKSDISDNHHLIGLGSRRRESQDLLSLDRICYHSAIHPQSLLLQAPLILALAALSLATRLTCGPSLMV